MAAKFGMMSDAYFVGKRELLAWLNDLLEISTTKVSECCSGAHYCQLLDCLYQGTVPLKRVDFSVKQDHEYMRNWNIIQSVFKKHSIDKKIPVERIIQGKPMDNLEFLQWFYQYFRNLKGDERTEYNATERRSRCKGGPQWDGNKPGLGGRRRAPPKAKRQNSNSRTQSSGMSRSSSSRIRSGGASRVSATSRTKTGPPPSKRRSPGAGASAQELAAMRTRAEEAEEQLEKLNAEHRDLGNLAQDMENERDFYFNKVVKVENICKGHETDGANMEFLEKIYEVLYEQQDPDGSAAATEPTAEPMATDTPNPELAKPDMEINDDDI